MSKSNEYQSLLTEQFAILSTEEILLPAQENPVLPIAEESSISDKFNHDEKKAFLQEFDATPLTLEEYAYWMKLFTREQQERLHFTSAEFGSYASEHNYTEKDEEYWDQEYWLIRSPEFTAEDIPYALGSASLQLFISPEVKVDLEELIPEDISQQFTVTKYGNTDVYSFGFWKGNTFIKHAETSNTAPIVYKDVLALLEEKKLT
jgi:hypothetical protein